MYILIRTYGIIHRNSEYGKAQCIVVPEKGHWFCLLAVFEGLVYIFEHTKSFCWFFATPFSAIRTDKEDIFRFLSEKNERLAGLGV